MSISTILRPDADGSIDEWSEGEDNHKINWSSEDTYQQVDDAIVNDTDYFGASNGYDSAQPIAEGVKTFLFPPRTIIGAIISVVLHFRVRSAGYDMNKYKSVLLTHSTRYESDWIILQSGSYQYTAWTDYTTQFLVNPYTGIAWTQAEIDALDAGIRIYAKGYTGASWAESDCSWYYIEVITASPANRSAQLIGPVW